ncbi:hypothetical protein [Terrimonas pollutisoli]|uniref:hypothetical protein n=1 Tax=Terrimonas pollutisoli TaxID=3034147 RepID=UPI0023EE2859|nr:hypothetical protein [Terrimonas sp. H1YJ31]
MKKNVFSFFLFVFVVSTSSAQVTQVDKKNNALSVGLYASLGGFSDSHIMGAGIDYWWKPFHPYKDSNDSKQIAFAINGGAHYFFGKHVIVNSYGFKFSNFLDMHIMPGFLYQPLKRSIIQLSAGPNANLYKQNIRVGVGANFFTSYYLTEKISAGPAIHFRKFSNTAALWSGGIAASCFF